MKTWVRRDNTGWHCYLSRSILLHYYDEGLLSDLQTITTLLWPGLSSQYSPGSLTQSTTQQWLPWLGTSARRSSGKVRRTRPSGELAMQWSVWPPAVCFRPWWDMMEDSLMYFFVIMSEYGQTGVLTEYQWSHHSGMVSLPMTFLSNTPLDCTVHHSLWPNSTHGAKIPHHTRFVQSYAKKYCSETHISPFLLYFPFTLLIAPMALTACEKIFIG